MQVSDWIASFAALFSAIAAVVSTFIIARWGKEFARAKGAQIEAKDAQIETLRSSTEKLLIQKDAQIETLRLQIETLRGLTSTKLYEYWVTTREQLEDYNEFLLAQLAEIKAAVQEKDAEIQDLKGKVTEGTRVEKIKSERDEFEAKVDSLEKELQEIRSKQRELDIGESELASPQAQILQFLGKFIEQHGYPPSIVEIGSAVGINSTSVVGYNLRRLEEKGFVTRDPEISRGVTVTEIARRVMSDGSRFNAMKG